MAGPGALTGIIDLASHGITCGGVGVATDANFAYLSCSGSNMIYVLNKATGNVAFSGNVAGTTNLSHLAYDTGRGVVWACSAGFSVVAIDAGTLALRPSLPGFGTDCRNGLAYDPCHDTLWASPLSGDSVVEHRPNGTVVGAHGVVGLLGGPAGRSSGLATGSHLFISNDGGERVFRLPKSVTTSALFATAPVGHSGEILDLECDGAFQAGLDSLWGRGRNGNEVFTWELEEGQCSCGGGFCPATGCDDGNPCTTDACDPTLGCVHTANDAGVCGDNNQCTREQCVDGACVPAGVLVCNDSNPCTNDFCVSAIGCYFQPNTEPCDDGNACTTETCANGACTTQSTVTCNDSNGCTDDACNPSTGACVSTPNTAPCSDGNACTFERCQNGTCTNQASVDCYDDNPCTGDTCNPATGVCSFPSVPGPCSDGDACTNETCQGGTCAVTSTVTCNDANGCTDDTCNPATGCRFTPNTAPCSDGNMCTTEACQGGACVGGPATSCDDTNPCTTDLCDPVIGCLHTEGPDGCTVPCGNGILDPGETCDPPDPTLNPATGRPTCREDCTYCGDGLVQPPDTCDDGNPVQGCAGIDPLDGCLNNCTKAICKDPSKIALLDGLDRFDFHGRLTDAAATAPTTGDLVVRLTDPADGRTLFEESIPSGALIANAKGTSFKYKNKDARKGGGVAKVKLQRVRGHLRAFVRTYGDASLSQASMTTHVFVGSEEWTVGGIWERLVSGWRFTGP